MRRWSPWLVTVVLAAATGGLLLMHGFGMHSGGTGAGNGAHHGAQLASVAHESDAHQSPAPHEVDASHEGISALVGDILSAGSSHAGLGTLMALCLAVLATAIAYGIGRFFRRPVAVLASPLERLTSRRVPLQPPGSRQLELCVWLC